MNALRDKLNLDLAVTVEPRQGLVEATANGVHMVVAGDKAFVLQDKQKQKVHAVTAALNHTNVQVVVTGFIKVV